MTSDSGIWRDELLAPFLRSSQETLLDHLPAFISFVDASERFVYVNARYAEFFGAGTDALRGRQVSEVLGADVYQSVRPYIRKALGGERAEFERQLTFPNGQTMDVMVTYLPHRGAGGEVTGYFGLVHDVTDRRRAERETARLLAEVRERLRLALVAAEAGAWWLAADGTVEWSEELHTLIGVARDVVPTLATWEALVHPDDLEHVRSEAAKALAGGDLSTEFRIIRPDGATRWLSSVGRATFDEQGRVTGVVGINQDVTDRKLAEEGRRKTAARYRSLVSSATDIIFTANARGHFIEEQPTWEAFTGQAWPQSGDGRALQMIHPEDREDVERAFTAAVPERRAVAIEFRLWHAASRAHRHVHARLVPLHGDDGAIDEWIGMIHDVDDKRFAADSSQFLASADVVLASSLDVAQTIDNICNLVVESFADWCLLYLAEEGALHRVATRHRDPEKARLLDSWHHATPASRQTAPEGYNVLESGRPVLREEVPPHVATLMERNPPLRDCGIESYVTVPLIVRGGVIGVLSCLCADPLRRYQERDLRVAMDLAQRFARTIDNARLYQAAQEAVRAKDEFLAVVSHELRTPMTAIIGWTGLLKMGETDPTMIRLGLNAIASSARAQAAIVDDLLEVSRIVAGKMRIEADVTTVGTAIEQAVETVRSAAEAKQIRLEFFSAGPVRLIRGDTRRLQQVFWNLLSNAVKFTPHGGMVKVTLEHGETHVTVRVTDNGRGIEPSFLPRVFERFTQAESPLTRSSAGLGLGLAIARSIVELHGGTIAADSEGLGHGATFIVTIPALEVSATVDAESDVELPRADSLANVRVLAVDDDEQALSILSTGLSRFGADVVTVSDVPSAMREIGRQEPDVVLSDLAMPFDDGFSLIAQLRVRERRVPAIAISAYSRAEDRARVLASGFDRFLTKPIDPIDVARNVAEVLAENR